MRKSEAKRITGYALVDRCSGDVCIGAEKNFLIYKDKTKAESESAYALDEVKKVKITILK